MDYNKKSAKDVLNYLSHLSELKKSWGIFSLEIDGPLYNIINEDGKIVFSCTKEIYNLLQEL